jgi:hypothetical protein
MSIAVDTKDCTALSDAELVEMADLCADHGLAYEVGTLSKQAEAWVLTTQVREGDDLRAYAFCTLERIGGTPCVLIGLGSVARTGSGDELVAALVKDQLRRAVLAFPDEDVLVAARFGSPAGFEAFVGLQGVVPQPGHRANGEERAWGGRLAKRYGIDASAYDKRAFLARGDGGGPAEVFDHSSGGAAAADPELAQLFAEVHPGKGDSVVAFGWAMEEDLRALG